MAYEFPEWVNGYIGLPFKERGRGYDGLDCWGLVALILREQFDVIVPSYIDEYKSTTDCETLSDLIKREAESWWAIPPEDAHGGDVIVMRITPRAAKNIYATHVGVVVEKNWMIHIEKGLNTVLDRYNRPRWGRRVVGVYRHGSLHR